MSKIVWKELVSKFSSPFLISDEKKINEEDLLNNENNTKNQTKKSQNEVKKKKSPPNKPLPPENDECCGSGCQRCVFDIYYDKLEKYEKEMEEYMKNIDF